jgi:hypothetical protein
VSVDPVEVALADAIQRAAVAGEWDIVRALREDLAARRATATTAAAALRGGE